MRILGIDPGTSCGWAVLDNGDRIASGVWDLKPRRHEGGGMRYLRFRRYLTQVLDGVEAVSYEEVRRHRGVDAAHVYGGILGQLTAVCESRSIPYRGIPVGTIKKLATGKGNASKEMMVEAFVQAFGEEPEADDEADALFCALALHEDLT